MSDISDYQVDHLLLLVGSNPVPNAVAGKLLTKTDGIITLIHSEDGFDLAKRLQAWFDRADRLDANVGLEEIKESDAASVSTCVQKVLDGYSQVLKKQKSGSNNPNKVDTIRIGLNYTGGTKVMSVHTYLALKRWLENKDREAIFSREPVFSYLDARTLQMWFEQVGTHDPIPFPVGRKVSMSIGDLLDLHNWEPITPPIRKPVLPESAKVLLTIYINPDWNKIWNEWARHTLPQSNNPREIPWPDLPKLQETMKKELGQDDAPFLNVTTVKGSGCENESVFRTWAGGTWLESAVLTALQACAKELQLEECCMDIRPRVRQSSENEPFFQLDVAAICGYQLFAFSCTTHSGGKGDLKQKLFEADVRARQIGGDEARTALVCRAMKKTTDALQNEMRRDIILKDRVRVFGHHHLTIDPDDPRHPADPNDADRMANNLAKHIKKWIIEQNGDRK